MKVKVRGRETVRMWVKVRDGEKGTVRVRDDGA